MILVIQSYNKFWLIRKMDRAKKHYGGNGTILSKNQDALFPSMIQMPCPSMDQK
jgi:hypothetical protein